MQQHHVGIFGEGLIEFRPDSFVIIVVDAAAEGDLGACRDQHFGLGAPAGGWKVSGVDHRRGHVGVADLGARPRPPCRAALASKWSPA